MFSRITVFILFILITFPTYASSGTDKIIVYMTYLGNSNDVKYSLQKKTYHQY